MSDIKTALILTAGAGNRRLPITRVVEKCMLPICNRPVVDYVVEQCIGAGITEIIFVVNDKSTLLREYYGESIDLNNEYKWLGMNGLVSIKYVIQDVDRYGYGTASAVLSAEDLLKDSSSFAVLAGDGFIYNPERNPLVDLFTNCTTTGLIGLKVDKKEIVNYGLINADSSGELVNIVEKPADLYESLSQSVVASVSYYVLDFKIFNHIKKVSQNGGEFFLTDAVNLLAKNNSVIVVSSEGTYLDSGQLDNWLLANNIIRNSMIRH